MSIKPWQLVLLGVILTIASALLNHLHVANINQSMIKTQERMQTLDTYIEDHWNKVKALESKRETAYMLIATHANRALVNRFVQDTLRHTDLPFITKKTTKTSQLYALMDAISEYQKTIIDNINTVYLDYVTLQDRIEDLQSEHMQFMSLSLFLQIIGLILVLSKDLLKH